MGDLGRRWRAVAALPTALGRTKAPPSNADLSGPIEVDVLHNRQETLAYERDRCSVGAEAMAGDPKSGVGSSKRED